ncbi:MAG: polysaccharide deacetylase [Lachnospiraceae bacterium]|nr:polysaccharide deacetylase [Lachnospiraceae bacterium]HBV82328.1 polysaccharide deacetylase [Lachnospiraceae bacterium]
MLRDKMDLDENVETNDRVTEVRKLSFIDILVPVLTLITIVNCVVILILVMNIGRKVNGLEQRLLLLEKKELYEEYEAVRKETSTELPDSENFSEVSEVADTVAVAELEDTYQWNGSEDRTADIRRVYLTFDDGPSTNTDRILDILAQYGVKATFFVIGKNGYTEQYQRIVKEGHTLGMHSYSHRYGEIYASLDAYKEDLTKLHDFLYELTGEDCNIVRFPGGSSNTISKVNMQELIHYLNQENMIYFDWNVSSGDASGENKNANQIAQNVLAQIDKYNNVVILFHDAAGKSTTVDALSEIIETILASDNTVILPISEDTAKVQHLHD